MQTFLLKLKIYPTSKGSSIGISVFQNQIKAAWQELAGSLDGLEEWITKKRQERITDQQIVNLLQKKLLEKQSSASA